MALKAVLVVDEDSSNNHICGKESILQLYWRQVLDSARKSTSKKKKFHKLVQN